ncbi:MAG: hypothetical protein ABIJ56_02880 [Pseudomonadota bacterium]
MAGELRDFRKNMAVVLADMAEAINEVAAAAQSPELREKIFALKRTVERAGRLCEAGELKEIPSPWGEPAPEFGENCRIMEL